MLAADAIWGSLIVHVHVVVKKSNFFCLTFLSRLFSFGSAALAEEKNAYNEVKTEVGGDSDFVCERHFGNVKVAADLEHEGNFGDGDHDNNDGLRAESFNIFVHEEEVALSVGRGSDDAHEEQPAHVYVVGGGDVEKKFEHKGI